MVSQAVFQQYLPLRTFFFVIRHTIYTKNVLLTARKLSSAILLFAGCTISVMIGFFKNLLQMEETLSFRKKNARQRKGCSTIAMGEYGKVCLCFLLHGQVLM